MTLLWHIAKKDLRLLRWPIAAWLFLTVADAVLRTVGPLLIDASRNETFYTLDSVIKFVPMIRGVLYVLIVALLVLADPLVGTESFWLTRPIPRRTLLASKLLVGVLVLIVPGLVTEIVVMLGFRVPLMDIVLVVPDILLGSFVMLVFVVFAATLAGNLMHFILGSIGVVIGASISLAAFAMIMFMRLKDIEPSLPRVPNNPTGEVVIFLVMLIAFLGTTWYHYRTRRRVRSLLLAIASLGLFFVLGTFLPPLDWFYGGMPQLPAEMQDPKVTSLRVTRPIRHVYDERSMMLDGPPHRRIAGPVMLDGVPDGYRSEPFTVSASVRMPDGSVFQSTRSHAMVVDVGTGHARPGGAYLSFGVGFRSPKPGTIIETWPILFRAPIDQMRQAGTAAGEYSGTFLYDFTRHEPLATMPLQRGIRFDDESRGLTVWPLGERGGACLVLVRRTILQRRGWEIRQPLLVESFRQRETGLRPTVHLARGTYFGLQFAGGSINDAEWGHWFHIFYQVLELLPEGTIYGAPMTGSVSCDGLELVLQRQSYAGRLVRTIAFPGFRLDAQPGDLTGDESNMQY